MSDFTAVAIAQAVRSGAASPTAAVEQSLDRIEARDKEIGAFRVVRRERALAEADELARRAYLEHLPLAGVPVAVKDNVAVAGESMRIGSAATGGEPCERDHPVVRRLRGAGAIVVGLTNVPELCLWGSCDSPYGTTRNPWDRDRTPGGSSGGSAAAVAAGMVPVAHGNDGLGSIRIPAANCGLFGIKPGRDVVPSELGPNSWFAMAENGPMSTTVADAAVMLSVLAARPEFAEPARLDAAASGRLRIAIAAALPSPVGRLDPMWADGLTRVADAMTVAGHAVSPARIPYPANPMSLFERWCAGAALDARGLDSAQMARRTRRHVSIGRAVNRFGLVRPRQVTSIESALRAFFADYDVVLTPTLAQCAPNAEGWADRSWLANVVSNIRYAPYASLWNLVGWPAASVPAGIHPEAGVPLGVQIAAPPGSEQTIMALAAQIERALPWRRVAPSYR